MLRIPSEVGDGFGRLLRRIADFLHLAHGVLDGFDAIRCRFARETRRLADRLRRLCDAAHIARHLADVRDDVIERLRLLVRRLRDVRDALGHMRDGLRDLLDALRHLLRSLRDFVRAALDLLQQRAQMLRHRMERRREMAAFIIRFDFERRLAQVAIRNALGRRFEAAQRMHDEVREAERRKEDQNERHDEADNQRDADVVRTREHLRAVHNRQILVARLVRRIDADEFRRAVEIDFLQALLAEVERGKLAEVCFAELREILVRVLRVSDDDAVLVEHHEIARLANLDLADAVRHDRQVDVEAEHAARLAAVALDDGENADGRRAFRRLERIRDADSIRVLHAVREPVALARIIARLALDSRILQVAAVHRAIAHDGDRALVRLAEALEQRIRLRLETALRGRIHRNHAVAARCARRSVEILRDVAALLQHGGHSPY